jgi:hypothetical protein
MKVLYTADGTINDAMGEDLAGRGARSNPEARA